MGSDLGIGVGIPMDIKSVLYRQRIGTLLVFAYESVGISMGIKWALVWIECISWYG